MNMLRRLDVLTIAIAIGNACGVTTKVLKVRGKDEYVVKVTFPKGHIETLTTAQAITILEYVNYVNSETLNMSEDCKYYKQRNADQEKLLDIIRKEANAAKEKLKENADVMEDMKKCFMHQELIISKFERDKERLAKEWEERNDRYIHSIPKAQFIKDCVATNDKLCVHWSKFLLMANEGGFVCIRASHIKSIMLIAQPLYTLGDGFVTYCRDTAVAVDVSVLLNYITAIQYACVLRFSNMLTS
jgi:hypothetical protein